MFHLSLLSDEELQRQNAAMAGREAVTISLNKIIINGLSHTAIILSDVSPHFFLWEDPQAIVITMEMTFDFKV